MYLDRDFADYCIEKASETMVSGFDVVVLSTSLLHKSVLITNDRRFYNNVKKHHKEVDVHLLRDMGDYMLKKLMG